MRPVCTEIGVSSPPRIFGIIGLARNSPQNPDTRELNWPNFDFVVCRDRYDLRLPHLSRFSNRGPLRTQIPRSSSQRGPSCAWWEVDHASTPSIATTVPDTCSSSRPAVIKGVRHLAAGKVAIWFLKILERIRKRCHRRPGAVQAASYDIQTCTRSIASHPCKERKDGAPAVGMALHRHHGRWAIRQRSTI
jgi:hypothetical protein